VISFFKRHKILTAVLLVILLPVIYFAFVGVKAYIDTPKIIAEINRSGRLTLKLEDFSESYLKALLAVEDPNFYHHNGIDMSTPGTGYTTITQGLVKMYFFDGFSPGFLRHRKIKQSLIAWVFNRRVDKQVQLHIFVNRVYLGNHNGEEVNGFQDGARSYFNKEFSELTEDEYLALVAMIVGPNEFNVATSPAKNLERVRRIKRMLAGECRPTDVGDVYYEQCAQ